MKCSYCGAKLQGGSNCSKCGAPLEESKEHHGATKSHVDCPRCGGSGTQPCFRQRGHDHTRCNFCAGTREIRCRICKGRGKVVACS